MGLIKLSLTSGLAAPTDAHGERRPTRGEDRAEQAACDREAVLAAFLEEESGVFAAAMRQAYEAESTWLDGVRAALLELLTAMDRKPHVARFIVVDVLTCGPKVLAVRSRLWARLVDAFERRRPAEPIAPSPAPYDAGAVMGAVAAILHARLSDQPAPSLRKLSGSLTAVLIAPYLGTDAARDELSRPDPG